MTLNRVGCSYLNLANTKKRVKSRSIYSCVIVVGRVVAGRCPATTHPATLHVCKTRGCYCSFRLLMMGGVSPETC